MYRVIQNTVPTPAKRPKTSTDTNQQSDLVDFDDDLFSETTTAKKIDGEPKSESTGITKSSATLPSQSHQTAIDKFPSVEKNAHTGLMHVEIEELATKVADLVVTRINNQQLSQKAETSKTSNNNRCTGQTPGLYSAENLSQFLELCDDFLLQGEPDNRILLCSVGHEYLKTAAATEGLITRPTGGATGALSLGLCLSEDNYKMS